MWIPADQLPEMKPSGPTPMRVSDVVEIVTPGGYQTHARLVSRENGISWVEYRGSVPIANVSYYRYL
jgi:hypothetical protein